MSQTVPATGAHPHQRAFVLRLHRDADPIIGPLIGRVEHVDSGLRLDFVGPVELDAALRSMLIRFETALAVAA